MIELPAEMRSLLAHELGIPHDEVNVIAWWHVPTHYATRWLLSSGRTYDLLEATRFGLGISLPE